MSALGNDRDEQCRQAPGYACKKGQYTNASNEGGVWGVWEAEVKAGVIVGENTAEAPQLNQGRARKIGSLKGWFRGQAARSKMALACQREETLDFVRDAEERIPLSARKGERERWAPRTVV